MKPYSMFSRIASFVISSAIALLCISFTSDSENVYSTEAEPDFAALCDEIVMYVNEAREANGLQPLYAVPVLNCAGQVRSEESVVLFSHDRPDGTFFNTILDEFNISYGNAAENIAAGSSTPEETFNQWKNSPNHWGSIINPTYTHMGVGVVYDPDTKYRWYWEQIFITSTIGDMPDQYLPERNPIIPSGYGDINGDGIVNCFDMIMLRKKLCDSVILNDLQLECADCVQDGVITSADARALHKYILGVYDTLPFTI
ncbi:MAG: CAP domain-containing protein [Ruminococcus sp.]|nr:CAP domain-containing protein [Oscillospiraceae bacterium]